MFNRRGSGNLLKLKFRQEFEKPRVWMGYLLGISQMALIALRYAKYAGAEPTQMFEPYMLLINTWDSYTLLMLGYFIVIANAPFVDSLSQTAMVRAGGRRQWTGTMVLYMCLQACLYWGAVIAAGVIPSLFCAAAVQNEWSELTQVLMKIWPGQVMETYGFSFYNAQILQTWRPYAAVFTSSVLSLLYMLTLAFVMFGFNMRSRFPLGTVLVLGIHFVGVFFIKNALTMTALKCSLLAHAMLDFHTDGKIPLGGSVILFLVLLLALRAGIAFLSARCDYRTAISEREW